MARKKPVRITPRPHSSSDEEQQQDGGLGEYGAVEEGEKEGSVKDRYSLSDSENTAPSPDVSDFIMKPIASESPVYTKPSTKRPAESEPSGTLGKKEKVESPAIVLGLSKQSNYSKRKLVFKGKESGKLASEGEESGKLRDKMDTKRSNKIVTKHSDKIDSKGLNELLREEMLKSGMGNGLLALMKEKMGEIQSEKAAEIGEKCRKLMQHTLELYIKRLKLVQEQTKLVLHVLESSEE